ncbi:hypothetical protein ABZ883_18345 [Streptomyces sp. NPDC046977]|uniref:hypothetical protein n=1 Tax=Streptomyces sp. NPDC046977 TaxID=3154703 RepID=UPI0033FFBB33
MDEQVVAAAVSGLVALVVGAGTGWLTWAQIRREREKWRTDLKTAWALEVHKARLAAYPRAFEVLRALSTLDGAVAPEAAGEVARELNDWLYSAGGLCADRTTRGALLGLRAGCDAWRRTGEQPPDLYRWRDLTMVHLRRDLDVRGLESYDFTPGATLLRTLEEELAPPPRRRFRGRRSASGRPW